MQRSNDTLVPIAIHGVPRSGTTWIGEIINSSPYTLYKYQPLFSYAHKDYLTAESSSEDISSFFSRLATCSDEFTCQEKKRQGGILPKFEKEKITHIAYKEVRYHNILANLMNQKHDLKLVAIIRNPLSVINSWVKAPREFRKDLHWNITEEWLYAPKKNLGRPEEFYGFEKWKEASTIFLELKTLYPDRVHLIKYSEFLNNPALEAKHLFDFLNLAYSNQTANFIIDSTSRQNPDPYSVFKGHQADDSWKTELPIELANTIQEELIDSHLERFLT